MPRKDISLLSPRELALTVLSKLLYHIATRSVGMEEIVSHHRNILQYYLNQDIGQTNTSNITEFSIYDIPWGDILDAIASKTLFLANKYILINSQHMRSDTCVPCYVDYPEKNMDL